MQDSAYLQHIDKYLRGYQTLVITIFNFLRDSVFTQCQDSAILQGSGWLHT
jgi:hypothetical protein